jgi:hypothetical protein
MFPSRDQVEFAAYHRWLRRGGAHGADREDWLAAEHELLFAFNYKVIIRRRLDGVPRQYLGHEEDRCCRFCEGSAPQVRFSAPRPVVPEFLGNTSLFTYDECDECHALFATTIERELERFARPMLECETANGDDRTQPKISLAAYKGLVKSAIALLPESELTSLEDTIEWVCNPDHQLDSRLFRGLQWFVSTQAATWPFSWAAVAKRIERDAPFHYLTFVIATGRTGFQIHLPLCARDEDLDGRRAIMPRALPLLNM